MDKFTLNDWIDIQNAVEKAREDDTPYAVHQKNGDLAVVGDANKTESRKSFEYIAKFRYEEKELEVLPENAIKTGRFVTFEHKFSDIHITPRNDLQLVEASLGVFPILKAFEENSQLYDGKAREIDPNVVIAEGTYRSEDSELQKQLNAIILERNKAMVHIYNVAGDEGQLSVYKFVQTMLNIDDDLADHMLPISVLGILYATIINNPEIINESETVFGY